MASNIGMRLLAIAGVLIGVSACNHLWEFPLNLDHRFGDKSADVEAAWQSATILGVGNWKFRTYEDPHASGTYVSLTLYSGYTSFVIECQERLFAGPVLSVYVSWPGRADEFTPQKEMNVYLAYDGGEAIEEVWSKRWKETFTEVPMDFIRNLSRVQQLHIWAYPFKYEGMPAHAWFSLDGLENALTAFNYGCE